MAGRPVYWKELGAFFTGLRDARGWNQSDAARFAQQRRIKALTRDILVRLEGGKVKNPEPAVLRALAHLYDTPYEELVRRYVAVRFGFAVGDLPRHASTAGSVFPQGDADDHAAARIRELEARVEQLQTYETIVRGVRPLLRDALVALGDEGGTPATTKAARRRNH